RCLPAWVWSGPRGNSRCSGSPLVRTPVGTPPGGRRTERTGSWPCGVTLGRMRLEGIHHVTCITADAPGNVDFYAGTLGLRLVKKSVKQDDPTVYHLFYADEEASYGSDITFFEYPGARRGRAGAGMVHTITWRVASDDAFV